MKGQDDKKTHYSVDTCVRQATKERIAAGQEAASAQVVERGHQVTMIEVPDEEDDTAYQRWIAKGSPLVTLTRPVMTLPMPPDSLIQIGQTYTKGQTYEEWQNQDKVTSPTVVMPPTADTKVREVPRQGWMKPYRWIGHFEMSRKRIPTMPLTHNLSFGCTRTD